jgi:GTP-binding protein EngB required for normal cell division
MLAQHAAEKGVLAGALEELMQVAADRENRFAVDLLRETKQRLERETFTLVILGEFKRGKSTFVNALLGEALLPTAIVPLTAIPTIIQYGPRTAARVLFLDGSAREIGIHEIAQYVTERENPGNKKQVREVHITHPSPFLQQGVMLVDTPGVGSVYQHNTEAAYAYLPRSDAAVFILSVDIPLSKSELAYLQDIKQHVGKLFFAVNKVDVVADDDAREAIAFTRQVLGGVFDGQEVPLLPISARLALEAKREGNGDKLERSGMGTFEALLGDFITRGKGRFIREVTAARALRILSELELELEIWRRAMEDTVEGLNEKIRRFNEELERLEQEREDSIYLLYREVDRLGREVEEDMIAFRDACAPKLLEQLEDFGARLEVRSAREAARELKEYVRETVRATLDAKRRSAREALQEKFNAVAARFFRRIEDIVDRMMAVSAEIFQVSVEQVAAKEYILGDRRFYFHFAEHPTFIPTLEDLPVMGLLPGRILRRQLVGNARKMLLELLDRNCGRVREDLVEGLKEEVRDVAGELRLRADAVARGLRAALEKAAAQRQASAAEKEAAERARRGQHERLQRVKRTLKEILDRGAAEGVAC